MTLLSNSQDLQKVETDIVIFNGNIPAAPRKKAVSALLLNWEKASFVFYADFRWLPEKSIIKKKSLWY